jgi:UDP-N-acetylmuramoyl-tripeptide--D-alanyl-D-alanine ligase
MSKLKQIFGSVILIYLRILSKIQLRKVKPIIVGITGSTGKTSFRDAVKLVLSVKYKVKVTEKANSESGIPLDILGIHMKSFSIFDWMRVCLLAPVKLITNWDRYDVYVVEMGVDSPKTPKNMEYLLKIVKPHIGVIINVSAVHSEQYDHLISADVKGKERVERIVEEISNEKGKMLKSIDEEGFSIGNTDDKNVQRILSECKSNIISFGKKSGSKVRIISSKQDKDTFRVVLSIDGKSYPISLKDSYLPEAYAYNFAGAMAVASALRVDLEKAILALQSYELQPGRMSVFQGIKNSTVIDSSYNSSKLSVIQGLNLVETLSGGKREKSLLVLGDMREMGDESKYEHEDIAIPSVKIADRIVLVGPMMKEYFYPKALELGFDKKKLFLFDSSKDAATEIENAIIKDGDVILIKGSQNTLFMESVVEVLLEDPRDKSKLCRRGSYWNKIRSRN